MIKGGPVVQMLTATARPFNFAPRFRLSLNCSMSGGVAATTSETCVPPRGPRALHTPCLEDERTMELKGSNTEQNLKDAFAGESQANRRYLYFPAKADVEGYEPQVMQTALLTSSSRALVRPHASLLPPVSGR